MAKTVAGILTKERDRVYAALGNGSRRELNNTIEVIKTILDEHKDEIKPVERKTKDGVETCNNAQRCIDTLSKCLNNQSKFLSTLVTWMSCIKVA